MPLRRIFISRNISKSNIAETVKTVIPTALFFFVETKNTPVNKDTAAICNPIDVLNPTEANAINANSERSPALR